jgi:hypothetical protein
MNAVNTSEVKEPIDYCEIDVAYSSDNCLAPESLVLSDDVTVDMVKRIIADCKKLGAITGTGLKVAELDYQLFNVSNDSDWEPGNACISFYTYPGNTDEIYVYQTIEHSYDFSERLQSREIGLYDLLGYLMARDA